MWDERYKGNILTFNNSRDAFAIAQFYFGLDVNSTNKADWDLAADKLKEQNPLLQGRVMDEVFNKMQAGNAAMAPYYAGDYLTMADVNPDLGFVYPKLSTIPIIPWQGTNSFTLKIKMQSKPNITKTLMTKPVSILKSFGLRLQQTKKRFPPKFSGKRFDLRKTFVRFSIDKNFINSII